MEKFRNGYRILAGRPEGKRSLGRLRRRWEDNIKMDLKEMDFDAKNWMNHVEARDHCRSYGRMVMNLWVP